MTRCPHLFRETEVNPLPRTVIQPRHDQLVAQLEHLQADNEILRRRRLRDHPFVWISALYAIRR